MALKAIRQKEVVWGKSSDGSDEGTGQSCGDSRGVQEEAAPAKKSEKTCWTGRGKPEECGALKVGK